MITSDVEAASMALYLLGHRALTSLADDSDAARIMNAIYLPTLDEALRAHDWNFARMRAALAALATAPAWGYTYQYQLPQDPLCLRVLKVENAEADAWEIETYAGTTSQYRVLVTDLATVKLLYIARVTDPTLWDSLFADAFVYELAHRAAYGLSGKAQLTLAFQEEKQARWRQARGVDGQEGRPLKRWMSDALTKDR